MGWAVEKVGLGKPGVSFAFLEWDVGLQGLRPHRGSCRVHRLKKSPQKVGSPSPNCHKPEKTQETIHVCRVIGGQVFQQFLAFGTPAEAMLLPVLLGLVINTCPLAYELA